MTDKTEEPIFEMFDVRVEAMVPCSLTYKIRAESIEDALKKFDKNPPTQFQPHILRKKVIKATVYNSGSLIIRGTKKF